MPTKRKRISHSPLPEISPTILLIVSEGLFPATPDKTEQAIWEYFTEESEKARVFEQCKDQILAQWIHQRPGTRPNFWWRTDAPEKARHRIGGVGDPVHEHLGYAELYDHGVPLVFVDTWSVEYYNGRAHDIHGEKIGTEYSEGDFRGRAIDRDDPPVYESQAAYLERHGLLTADEKRRLKPKDFKPEIILRHE